MTKLKDKSGLEMFISILNAKKDENYAMFHALVKNLTIEQRKEILTICEATGNYMKDSVDLQTQFEDTLNKISSE